jgi:hypothetical protein
MQIIGNDSPEDFFQRVQGRVGCCDLQPVSVDPQSGLDPKGRDAQSRRAGHGQRLGRCHYPGLLSNTLGCRIIGSWIILSIG